MTREVHSLGSTNEHVLDLFTVSFDVADVANNRGGELLVEEIESLLLCDNGISRLGSPVNECKNTVLERAPS